MQAKSRSSRSGQIALNALSQWGGTLFTAVVGLMIVPPLIARLGRDGYGLIALALGVTAVCMLADLGIAGALGRHLAQALTEKDERQYGELLSTAVALHATMGVLTGTVVFLLAPTLAGWFGLKAWLYPTGVLFLRTYGVIHVVLAFLSPAARAVMASHHRFDRANALDALRKFIETAGLVLVLIGSNAGIGGWAAVCITSDCVCVVLFWRVAAKTHPGLIVSPRLVRFSRLRELFGLGTKFSLTLLSIQLGVEADPFILSTCLGPASVALYRPPGQIASTLNAIVMTVANQIHPLATKAHVEGARADLARILIGGTKYTVLMGTTCCAILVSLAHPLCKIWLGRVLGDQYSVCATVLIVHCISQIGAFCAGTQWPVLVGINRTGFAAYGRLALAFVNFLASWLLVRYTSLGVVGVVIPTMIVQMLWWPVLGNYVCRAIGIRMWDYLRESYGAAFLIGALLTAFGFAVRTLAHPQTLLGLAAIASLLGVTGLAAVWMFGLSGEERGRFLGVARSFAQRV